MDRADQAIILVGCIGIVTGTAFIGCSPSRDATEETSAKAATDQLREFEKGFRPSDYSIEITHAQPPPSDTAGRAGTADTAAVPPAAPETVQGFRVQIISTSSIDEANATKADAESLFPGEWFYVEYDPPAYKIRAGNFLKKLDAERFRMVAQERGYRGAWIVPAKVFKNPPPPPAREIQLPQNQ